MWCCSQSTAEKHLAGKGVESVCRIPRTCSKGRQRDPQPRMQATAVQDLHARAGNGGAIGFKTTGGTATGRAGRFASGKAVPRMARSPP